MHLFIESNLTNSLRVNYQEIFEKYNDFSELNPILGRLGALPVALVDTSMDTLVIPLIYAIEAIAVAAILLYRITLTSSNAYRLKDVGAHIEMSGMFLSIIPIKVLIAPLKILYQTACILRDPVEVVSLMEPGIDDHINNE